MIDRVVYVLIYIALFAIELCFWAEERLDRFGAWCEEIYG